jgi:hypothetical protein
VLSYLSEFLNPTGWGDLLSIIWPILALVAGFFLISMIKKNPPIPSERPGEPGEEGPQGAVELDRLRGLPPQAVARALRELLESLKLEIQEEEPLGRDGVLHLVALNPAPLTGGRILVECATSPEGGAVDAPTVLSLLDAVRAEQALKGIYTTPYGFTAEARSSVAGTQVDLLDGEEMIKLLKKHAPAWLVEQPA